MAESFGAGVATALTQYASATPDLEHHLLRTVRKGDYIDGGEEELFASVTALPKNPFAARQTIKTVVKDTMPSVIHAHSSFGGAYVRTSIRATSDMRIVYTPHGYSFERRDISGVSRTIYRLAEYLLSRNTSIYAACSPREAHLSAFSGYKGRIIYVPNVAEKVNMPSELTRQDKNKFTVVGIGRLAPQRDPLFFAEVVRIVRDADPTVQFTWIGGGEGEATYASALKAVGVDVTGWLSRHNARALLNSAELHIHTATWDGFPMVLLEANQSRLPSLVRDVEPFALVPAMVRSSTPEEMAQTVLNMRDAQVRKLALNQWDCFLEENRPDIQRQRLMDVYLENA